MSLRVTGYTPEGKRIVIDEGPSSVNWAGPIRGSLIQGAAGAVEQGRITSQAHHAAERAEKVAKP